MVSSSRAVVRLCDLVLLHLGHLHHLDLAVLLNELLGIHVSTTDPDDQFVVDNLGQDLLRPEHVVIGRNALDFNFQLGLVEVLGEHLVDYVAFYGFVEFDLFDGEDLAAHFSVLVLKILATRLDLLGLLQQVLDALFVLAVDVQHGVQVHVLFFSFFGLALTKELRRTFQMTSLGAMFSL